MVEMGTVKQKRPATRPGKLGTATAALALAGILQVTGVPGLGELGIGMPKAEAQRAQREKPQTRASKSLTDSTAKELLKSYEAFEAGNTVEAIAILNRLLQRELNDYDRARVNMQLGSYYADQGDYKRSIAAFERAERLNALDEFQQNDLKLYLGQLYMADDRVNDAIAILTSWYQAVGPEEATPDGLFALAQAYAVREDYTRALQYAEAGLAKARANNDLRESWLSLTSMLYYQNQQIRNMQNLLREMVGLFPGRARYWNQLSSTYALQDDETTAYYIKVLVDLQGMLAKSSEYNVLASLHVYNEVPIRGAEVMERGLANGVAEKNDKNYEILATAYQESREWKKAIPPLQEAAQRSDDGELYIRLCQSYLLEQDYARAETACVRGINKGGLRDTGTAWMLLGSARYSQDKLEDAKKAFENAAKYENNARTARQWIQFLNQTMAENKRKAAEREAREKKRAAEAAADGA